MGGTPPLNRKSANLLQKDFFPKRAKNDVFLLNKVKNEPKRPYSKPKRAKNV